MSCCLDHPARCRASQSGFLNRMHQWHFKQTGDAIGEIVSGTAETWTVAQ